MQTLKHLHLNDGQQSKGVIIGTIEKQVGI
jgi:hypothetical protein